PQGKPTQSAEDAFHLEVLPAAEGLDLIDPDEKKNELDESGAWGLNTLSNSLEEQKHSAPQKVIEKEPDIDTGNSLLELDDGGQTAQPVKEAPRPQTLEPAPKPDAKTGKTLTPPKAPLKLELDGEEEAPAPPPPAPPPVQETPQPAAVPSA